MKHSSHIIQSISHTVAVPAGRCFIWLGMFDYCPGHTLWIVFNHLHATGLELTNVINTTSEASSECQKAERSLKPGGLHLLMYLSVSIVTISHTYPPACCYPGNDWEFLQVILAEENTFQSVVCIIKPCENPEFPLFLTYLSSLIIFHFY